MVYIIADIHREYMKIGVTSNITTRLATLQSNCPLILEIVKLIKLPDASLDYALEKELHSNELLDKVQGEWFKYNKEFIYDAINIANIELVDTKPINKEWPKENTVSVIRYNNLMLKYNTIKKKNSYYKRKILELKDKIATLKYNENYILGEL